MELKRLVAIDLYMNIISHTTLLRRLRLFIYLSIYQFSNKKTSEKVESGMSDIMIPYNKYMIINF